jgi:hypothetical protein
MYEFRPAVTTEAKPLIGLFAESGCGKTMSALLLAKGFTENMRKVGMIETESGRGEVFADDPVVGGYRVLSIREDFSPKNYGKAITAAEKADLRVLIIDSASHEWDGAGGVLAMAAKNQAEGKKGPIVWQQPKIDHAREFVLRLLQTPIPLVIVCMRAKYPMTQVTADYAKTHPGAKVGEWVRDTELSPKQSEDILYEMMVHGWIDKEHRLHVTKYTKEAFRSIFLDGEPITVKTGERLAAWAAGASVPAAPRAGAPREPAPASATRGAAPSRNAIIAQVTTAAEAAGWGVRDLLKLILKRDIRSSRELTEADVQALAALTPEQLKLAMENALADAAAGK